MGKRRNKLVGVGSAVTWYRYDLGWNMVAEYTDANSDMTIENRTDGYVYTPGGQMGMALARNVGATLNVGTYSYFTQDHLGSTRGLWDGAKLRLAKLNYAPYGEQNGIFGDAPDLQFTGKAWDSEIGMYYFPYRYYSPSFKRWLTRDPLGMVDGPNVYGYVRGNPVGLVDPKGDFAWALVLLIAFIASSAYFGTCMRLAKTAGDANIGGIGNARGHCVAGCEFGRCFDLLPSPLDAMTANAIYEFISSFTGWGEQGIWNDAFRDTAAAGAGGLMEGVDGEEDCVVWCERLYPGPRFPDPSVCF